ncbi:MAG TPA: hypothetical protein VFR85_04695 [Anaeromyxobacteraceae bacterium]|nr:hypothetical protein [Anaeromyxobacteraceae bacterium]
MRREATVARRRVVATAAPADLAGLRRRFPAQGDRDAVVLDFLEDDLAETRGSLSEVSRYLDDVEAALGDAGTDRGRLLGLALGRGPLEQLEYLSGVVQNLRRRLVQVSARMGR